MLKATTRPTRLLALLPPPLLLKSLLRHPRRRLNETTYDPSFEYCIAICAVPSGPLKYKLGSSLNDITKNAWYTMRLNMH